MLKIKDNTSKQKLSYINATFWNNQKIKEILINMKSIRNGIIYINDVVVNEYSKSDNQLLPKSNASFVKQVKKLNKENYFDFYVDKETCAEYIYSYKGSGCFIPRLNADGTLKTNKECIYKLEANKDEINNLKEKKDE